MSINISDNILNQCEISEEEFKTEIALLLFEARKMKLEAASNLAEMQLADFKQLLNNRNISLRSFTTIKLISILISLFLLILGIGCDFYSKNLEPKPQRISIVQDGSPIQKTILSPRPMSIITGIASSFFYGLAGSIIIIIFIESGINRVQQTRQKEELKEFQKAINQNIFKAIFETVVPEEIFKILISDVIGNKILRKDAEWRFNFKKNNNELELIKTVRYKIYNVSSLQINSPLTIILKKLSNYEESELLKASCTINGTNYDYYDSKAPQSRKGVTINNGNKDISSIDLELKMPPETYAEITTIIKTTFRNYRADEVIDFFGTKYPIINGKLTVTFPPEYSFDIFSYLSTPFKKIESSSTEQVYVYEFKGGVLPYQGFAYSLNWTLGKKQKESATILI